jgi:hypothetical protein
MIKKAGDIILKDLIDENGEVHLDKEGVDKLIESIDFRFTVMAETRMSCDLRDYLQSAKDDEYHTYDEDIIDEHFEYYADCWARGLSAYKANCFFHFHLEEQKGK